MWVSTMSMRPGVFGPDSLKVLQQIFDVVWKQVLEENGDTRDPVLRWRVSKLVLEKAKLGIFDLDGIRLAVLQALNTHRPNWEI